SALEKLLNLKWNYLVIPEIDDDSLTFVSAWIKEQRAKQKTFKVVLPNYQGDHEAIINFTTDNINSNLSDVLFSTAEYCARIAGMLAGLSLTRSSTYFVFNDIVDADVPTDDAGTRIDKGEFIIIYDGENFKVGRGVNSLTTFTTNHGEDFSKIKIVEGVDLYNDDIRTTFEDFYVGKYINDYDNKQAFVASINAYNKTLEGDVLDKTYDNITSIDIDAQKLYLEGKGIDTSSMSDIELAKANTGSNVFVTGNIKFVDAMEDLDMINYM
ncbi:MAG: phage tail sheath C-terminal domain-containing protein, partial [bacterium]